ncbi:MAG TPA: RTX toxin [Polyangia bacterium]|jgi:alpha-tubulin suppressor-like RCC1 family protein|nr:RTX toxin [Polyangia bacterium]
MNRRFRFWKKYALYLSMLGAGVPHTACGPASHQAGESDQVKDVTISINASSVIGSTGASSASGAESRIRQGSDIQLPAAFDYSTVKTIVLNVSNNNTQRAIFSNFKLTQITAGGPFTGTLPFLPANVPLAFSAQAFDGSATPVDLFDGTTVQTLTQDNTNITISLAPHDDKATYPIPRITSIAVPSQIGGGENRTILVQIQGSSGEVLNFSASSDASGGQLFPSSGAVTLTGSPAGSFVLQYTAPDLSDDTDLTESVTITNARGTAVKSTFTIHVLKRGLTTNVKNTPINVQFRPVIDGITAQHPSGTNNVTFDAKVSINTPDPSKLTYAWTLTPDSSYTPPTPAPSLANSAVNPATLQNYDSFLTGKIQLVVSDPNGPTTLNYTITAHQFDDPVVILGSGGNGIAGIEAGGYATCAVETNGNIRCWGQGQHGQLGYGNPNNLGVSTATLPKAIGDVPSVVDPTDPTVRVAQMGVGYEHTCVLFQNGLVSCWGLNDQGQLGYANSTTSASSSLRYIGDDEPATQFGYVNIGGNVLRLAVGGYHTCALVDSGGATPGVRCWGRNGEGQLGYASAVASVFGTNNGDTEQPYVAGDVQFSNLNGATITDIQAGQYHTCVLLSDGNVRCWGYNAYGQLGIGTAVNQTTPPTSNIALPTSQKVRQLYAGFYHNCAVFDTANGGNNVRCWGYNPSGQLGFASNAAGNSNDRWGDAAGETPASATAPALGAQALQVVAGSNHSCAILTTGEVRCWGLNNAGQLGNPAVASSNSATINLPGAGISFGAGSPSAVRLTAGSDHSCALLTTGFVSCWGFNNVGQLGYGHTNTVSPPSAANGGNVPIL